MNETLRVLAFDLDDTLTVSKSRIDQHMAGLLSDLLARLNRVTEHTGRTLTDPHAVTELTLALHADYLTPAA